MFLTALSVSADFGPARSAPAVWRASSRPAAASDAGAAAVEGGADGDDAAAAGRFAPSGSLSYEATFSDGERVRCSGAYNVASSRATLLRQTCDQVRFTASASLRDGGARFVSVTVFDATAVSGWATGINTSANVPSVTHRLQIDGGSGDAMSFKKKTTTSDVPILGGRTARELSELTFSVTSAGASASTTWRAN